MGCASSTDTVAAPSACDRYAASDSPRGDPTHFAHADPALARALDAPAADAQPSPDEIAEHQRLADEWSVESGGAFTDEPSPFVLGARAAKAVMLARFKHDINDDADQFAAEPEPAECIAESTALAETWLEELPLPSAATAADDSVEMQLPTAHESTESASGVPACGDPSPQTPSQRHPVRTIADSLGQPLLALPNAVPLDQSADSDDDEALDRLHHSDGSGDGDSESPTTAAAAAANSLSLAMVRSFSMSVNDDCHGILTPMMAIARVSPQASSASAAPPRLRLTTAALHRHCQILATQSRKPRWALPSATTPAPHH